MIEDYLEKETTSGNIFGQFCREEFPTIHVNRFGVILKKHQQGKWQLITELSFPKGASVNDAIDSSLCSRTYIT